MNVRVPAFALTPKGESSYHRSGKAIVLTTGSANIGESALAAAEQEKKVAEQNAAHVNEVEDIFGVVEDPKNPEDTNIF